MASVIDRLSKQLDDMDKEDEQKGMHDEMKGMHKDMGEKEKRPDFLDIDGDEDREETMEEASEDMDEDDDDDRPMGKPKRPMEELKLAEDDNMADKDDKKDEEKKDKMYKDDMEKSEYSDVITSEYLDWMENTLKSAGVDTGAARAHFDGVAKANLGSTPEQIGDGANYFGGQVKGRAQEGGSPSTNAISRMNSGGGKEVAKGYLAPDNVSASDLEAAYEVYKAAALEQQFKGNLNTVFSDRLQKELSAEAEAREASSFDARGPLASIEKAIADLSTRIDGLTSEEGGATLRKAVDQSAVEIPSTEELANMDWSQVHQLAGSVWN